MSDERLSAIPPLGILMIVIALTVPSRVAGIGLILLLALIMYLSETRSRR